KKLLIAAVFTMLGSCAFAQTSKGTVVLSGSLGFSTNTSKPQSDDGRYKAITYNLAPSAGLMLNDKLEVGTTVSYSYSRTESKSYIIDDEVPEFYGSRESTDRTVSLQPYLKKYFMVSEKIAITGKAYADLFTGSSKSESDYRGLSSSSETKNRGFGIGVSPGITFFPTERIGLSANFGNLSYTRTTYEHELRVIENTKSTRSGLDLNLSSKYLTFGFGYFINR
ncbi:outer membrane beta-barrel protein, partial [Pontibacter rugosus]